MPPRGKQSTAKLVMEAEMKEAKDEMAAIERRLEEEAREKNKHNLSTSEGSSEGSMEENSLTDSQPMTQSELKVLYSTKAGGSSRPSEPQPQAQSSAPVTPDPLRLESAPRRQK